MRVVSSLMILAALVAAEARADPCGMVPPVDFAGGGGIERTGTQRTYVSFRDGLETMALRPGFQGQVDEFGMLIPFPTPPAIRKIDDDTFASIESAVDPPQITVQIYDSPPPMAMAMGRGGWGVAEAAGSSRGDLAYEEVNVLREEAVGMYQVAVLEAGSAAGLRRWMGDNGYQFPAGMEAVTDEYVQARWCFVAVKAAVGQGPGVAASPGMRETHFQRPSGSSFDGHVQGMAFRFRTDRPVVPMRLSVFNGPDPRNVVYVLADQPLTLHGVNQALVSRQIPGQQLHDNLTQPLPVTYKGGGRADLSDEFRAQLDALVEPSQYSGAARDLFAADLLAARTDQLVLPHEEVEKSLLNISEALGMRGPETDALLAAAVTSERQRAIDGALDDLREMNLSVIDGVFPGDLLASEDLTFETYAMAQDRNLRRSDPLRAADQWLTYYKNGGGGW